MAVEPRLFIEDALHDGAELSLPPDQARYLTTVMRRGPGDGVRLFNGRDGEWRAEIAEAGKKSVILAARERLREQVGVPDLHLLFAPVKKARTDFIVEKATELGVAAIRPVFTERSIAERVRTDRLRLLAREAAEQTERLDLPEVAEAEKLSAALDGWEAGRALIYCDESGDDDSAPWGGEAGRAGAALEVLRAALFVSPQGPTPTLPQGGGSYAGDAGNRNDFSGDVESYSEPKSKGKLYGTLETDAAGTPSPLGEGRGGARPKPQTKALAQARRMRAAPTQAESKLWEILRSLKRPGAHFRRQAVIGPFIADFACLSAKLIVEADGGGHGGEGDHERDVWLWEQGYRVVRVWNGDVLGNPEGVAEQIGVVLAEQMERDPTPALPQGGGSSVGVGAPSGAAHIESERSARRFEKLAVLIGPEGGFSPGERARLRAHANVIRISLGPRILRADTACAAALTLVQAVWGDWN